MVESLRESVGIRPDRTAAERWADIEARHPEILPKDWADTAGTTRERSLYVDLREGRWSGPEMAGPADFERLQPTVTGMLEYLERAYEREIKPLTKPSRDYVNASPSPRGRLPRHLQPHPTPPVAR
jgi:hypothetical protein